MRLQVHKYEAAGNDFILIDDRLCRFPIKDAETISWLCDRHVGVGADGVVLLQNPSKTGFSMRVFNKNGSEAEACGNGLRCLARFIADQGLADPPYSILLQGQATSVCAVSEEVSIQMCNIENLKLNLLVESIPLHFVNSGVPHAVSFRNSVDDVDLESLARILRNHHAFAPHGANISIAAQIADTVHVRTYERGVEGETLACGTGGIAVALLGAHLFGWQSPVHIRYPGGNLRVNYDNDFGNIILTGPARSVFSAELNTQSIAKAFALSKTNF